MIKRFICQQKLLAINKKSVNSGFTLLEVLLAVTIFALIAMMFIGTLNYLISALSTQKLTYQEFQIPDMAYEQIKLDLIQANDRDVLGKNGVPLPIFFGGQDKGGNKWEAEVGLDLVHDRTLFEFTRAGNLSTLSDTYSGNLERISYVIQNGNLIRYSWPILDRVEESMPDPQILLNNVQTASVEFFAEDGLWHEGWQPKDPTDFNKPPLAVRLKCQIANLQPIEWMFWIGHGSAST